MKIKHSEIVNFRAEHLEAERHNRGQFNAFEQKQILRTYKKSGLDFGTAAKQLAEYADLSGTTVADESVLKTWWNQIR